MDGSGDLYGTTISDGANGYGTVFKVDPTGKETTLHDFANAADGAFPWSQLVQDDKCNLYGTAGFGRTGGYGTSSGSAPMKYRTLAAEVLLFCGDSAVTLVQL
jgi:uncharacterized repeat protein (TIGR03803 family)